MHGCGPCPSGAVTQSAASPRGLVVQNGIHHGFGVRSVWRSHGRALVLLLLLLPLLLLRPRATPLGSRVWALQKAPPVACSFVDDRVFRGAFFAVGSPVPCSLMRSARIFWLSRVLECLGEEWIFLADGHCNRGRPGELHGRGTLAGARTCGTGPWPRASPKLPGSGGTGSRACVTRRWPRASLRCPSTPTASRML